MPQNSTARRIMTFDRPAIPHEYQAIPDTLYNYIIDLYGDARGYVKLHCGKNRSGWMYSTDYLTDRDNLSGVLSNHRFTNDNLYMTISTYKSLKNAQKANLLSTVCLTVDCDIHHDTMTGINEKDPDELHDIQEKLCEMVFNGLIPCPTYIEYGRNFRLIYILEQPFVLTKNKGRGIKLLERIQMMLTERINAYVPEWHADSAPRLTSHVRIPYSNNKRDYGGYDFSTGQWNPLIVRYFVEIKKIGPKISLQDMIDIVLPDLPDWYEGWKTKKKAKKSTEKTVIKLPRLTPDSLSYVRMHDLETLQERGWCDGYREKMCHLYYQSALITYDHERATELTVEYNRKFAHPLQEHTVRVECCHTQKLYKYKDQTIREMLECESETDLFAGKAIAKKERDKAYYDQKRTAKEKAGLTKKQQIEKNRKKVAEMRASGMKWQAIADALGVSLRTAKSYGKETT